MRNVSPSLRRSRYYLFPRMIIYALLPVGRSLKTSANASSHHAEIPHVIHSLIYGHFFLLNSLTLSSAPLPSCRRLMGLFCNVLPGEDNRILQTVRRRREFCILVSSWLRSFTRFLPHFRTSVSLPWLVFISRPVLTSVRSFFNASSMFLCPGWA